MKDETKTLEKRLNVLKNGIISKKRKLLELSSKKKGADKIIKEYSKDIIVNIMNMTDAKGKLVYGNQAKRDNAFNEAVEGDTKYDKFNIKIENLEDEIKVLTIDLEEDRYDFKILEIINRTI